MAEARETRVFYKAIADFSNLKKELRQVRTDIAKTQAAESAYNAQSAKERAAATKASQTRAKAMGEESKSLKAVLVSLNTYKNRQNSITVATRAANVVINAQNRALKTNAERLTAASLAAREYASAQRSITKSTGLSTDAIKAQKNLAQANKESAKSSRELTQAMKDEAAATEEANRKHIKFVKGIGDVDTRTGEVVRSIEDGAKKVTLLDRAFHRLTKRFQHVDDEGRKLPPVLRRMERDLSRVHKGLTKFGNWRPRLVPPFIALVPIIGAVVAALNPLVAIIGTLGPLTVGLAGNIGSLAGAFLALPGILSAVVAGIAGVIASMGGVGSVFKAYSAMQKATGQSGSSGQTQAERAEALADAERGLAKAQKNVTRAQENLNKARKEALEDLKNLRLEVERAALTEERAIANLQLAKENYWNTMADPGSTAGDKLDAAAEVKEAEADLADVRAQNKKNAEDLAEAEKKGVEGSDRVVDARERVTDATEAQRDAERKLKEEQQGGSAAVKAINEYKAALDELSPSARRVVEAIISMQDQWKDFRRDMQETFFSQISTKALSGLPTIIQNIESFLKPAAEAMGELADAFLLMFASPEWSRDLKEIGKQNGAVVKELGDGFLNLAKFVKDLMRAAGPFTEWMATGFKEGAENFSELLDTKAERDGLADWLTLVEGRMRKWWQIVKNIGKTIFNYSAAASEFGDWLSDGFLKLTEGWRKSSELARENDSPFKKWLDSDELRNLLLEVRGLFGDFFRWFRNTSMDPENMEGARRLVKVFRDDLGPAVGRVLDLLGKSTIDEQFVEALSSIVEALGTIIEAGGGKAFEAFFTVIEDFFRGVSEVVKFIGPVLPGLLAFIGQLVALSFIGKFTGITFLFGALIQFIPSVPAFMTFVGGMKALSLLKFVGVAGLVTALIALPDLLRAAGGFLDKWMGYDTDTFSGAAKAYVGYKEYQSDWQSQNEKNPDLAWLSQGRNWTFDAFRAGTGRGRSWMQIDDELKELLRSGNIEEFKKRWGELNKVVGEDTPLLWSEAKQMAEDMGVQLEELDPQIAAVGEAADKTKNQIKDMRDALSGRGDSKAWSRTQAEDAYTAALERLEAAAKAPGASLEGTNEASRNFRDAIGDAEQASRDAARAIEEDGGTLKEAQGPYEELRKKVQDYATQLGSDPGAAQAWADNQFGPLSEVLDLIAGIYDEMLKLDKLEEIELQLSLQAALGFDPNGIVGTWENYPTVTMNGVEVIDFWALGQQGTSGKKDDKKKGNPNTGKSPHNYAKGGGGAGGGMSVGTSFGLADAVKKETDTASATWSTFWDKFNKKPGKAGEALKTNSSKTFGWINTNVYAPFKKNSNTLSDNTATNTNNMSSAWSTLQKAFAEPINWVINNVYNKGIVKFWNDTAGKLGMTKLVALPSIGAKPAAPVRVAKGPALAQGGVLPGYTPGRDVHDFYSPTAGNLHLSGGEAIMRPEFTKLMGGEKGIAALNKKAKSGNFATGGVFGGSAGKGDFVSDILGGAVGKIGSGLKDFIKPFLKGIPNSKSPWGAAAKAIPNKIIDGLVKAVKEFFGGGGSPANAMGWYKQWAAVQKQFPNATLYSAYRTPAQNVAVGGAKNSFHTQGRAIDVTPSMEIFNWIRKTYPNASQLIYSPANARQLSNGKNYMYPEPTRSDHWDHVHWAMKNGGVFDNGGWLKNGGIALNRSGKPEAVLDPLESRALKSLLSGSGLSARPAFGASSATAISGAPTVIDNSINLGGVTIINPVPEKISESLPKAIRRIGYMNLAREGQGTSIR